MTIMPLPIASLPSSPVSPIPSVMPVCLKSQDPSHRHNPTPQCSPRKLKDLHLPVVIFYNCWTWLHGERSNTYIHIYCFCEIICSKVQILESRIRKTLIRSCLSYFSSALIYHLSSHLSMILILLCLKKKMEWFAWVRAMKWHIQASI